MLPAERLEWVSGWGDSAGAAGYVFRPSTLADVFRIFEQARAAGLSITPRGSGCSYGDAAFRAESGVLDLTRMDRVLGWDPEKGEIEVEPGVTLRRLWRYVLGDGWWPPVVTGTMEPTIGGCLAMNTHGKNNWARGPICEHCLEIDLVTPDGGLRTIRAGEDKELFNAVVGSFGTLGIITRAKLQMKKVASGFVEVKAVSARNLEAMLTAVDDAKDDWEYVVGWVDAFAKGKNLGRGLLHYARHLDAGEDPHPARSLDPRSQDLPEEFIGLVPKSVMWRFLKPLTNRTGMRWINRAKYRTGSSLSEGALYRQTLAEFSFLLDYVPNWKKIYLPGGLIQHQSFVPASRAEDVFRSQLEMCQRAGQPSFLGVLKRHRPDNCLLGHSVDGFSLALDFPVLQPRKDDLFRLVGEMATPVVDAGGRFYPAKDLALEPELFRATLRDGRLDRLLEHKAALDPEGVLRSALTDRLLGGVM
jgi:decaprenylphospho-beta-D-ribofuranose 2-oxidase